MSIGPLLAEGRTAEIYAWGQDQVVKLYREGWPRNDAEKEAYKTRAAHQSGFAIPTLRARCLEITYRGGTFRGGYTERRLQVVGFN
ncbi:MAG: hypothetical protein FVQ83_00780 [Chloroflexi bacterium]|nr:hypothetical protein [Chloroflexota bacterium]